MRRCFTNRASALTLCGRPREALESFDAALAINPANAAEVWNNRGNALREMNRPDDAIASYDKAIALNPDYAKALCNRANAFWVDLKKFEPALRDFERAFALDPNSDYLLGDLLHLRMHLGDWRDFDRQKQLIEEGLRAGRRTVGPFAYQAMAIHPADLMTCSRMYAQQRYPQRQTLAPTRHDHAKIRIGYLGGEFREQATSFLMAGVYEQHDRGKFHITAFDSGHSDGSPLRHRLEKAFDAFVDISTLSDSEAAEKIAAAEIDILVNLNGYFGRHRMGVFARRPAPVQINYLGFPATLGAPHMDYILADRIVIPEEEKQFYTEQVVWLPDSYQANDSRRVVGDAPSRAGQGLPESAFVFCHFNQSYKLTPAIFASWMRIMRQMPDSVLWLLESNLTFPENIRREAAQAGIAPERIIFAPMISPEKHLARIQLADLFLDSSPYNAHTTASDALWAGVPLVTVKATTFPGRVAESLLRSMGLPELVAENMADYEGLAVKLAGDPVLLKSIRRKIQAGRETQPLFDTARFCRSIEAAYAKMWETAKQGRPPQGFAVQT